MKHKYFFIAAAFLVLSGGGIFAREKESRWLPAYCVRQDSDGPRMTGMPDEFYIGHSPFVDHTCNVMMGRHFTIGCYDYCYAPDYSIGQYYEDYMGPVYTTGLFYGGAGWLFCSRTMVTFDVGATGMFSSVNDPLDGAKSQYNGVALYLLPGIKQFFNSPRNLARPYVSTKLGAVFYAGKGFSRADLRCAPAVDFCAIGLEFGRKVSGFFEISAGTPAVGVKYGLSYRF